VSNATERVSLIGSFMPSLLVGGHVCVDQTDGASCARTFFKFFCCLYKCSCFIVADLCLLLEIAIGIGKKGLV
jgi:hypothetical protein